MDGSWTVPGYRHVRTLGEGASGTVVLAVHEETGTPAAVKYLSEALRSDPDFLDRFRDEARLMARLDDPNIVRLYEYVETQGAAALVMELVDGVTLKDILKSEGATGPEAALVVLKGSLYGLASAHAAGVVHRDYKPANVLVDAEGTSKLADFGIAVRADERATASGTPAYMAPEQWSSGSVGPATDVYAATAVFYECLTGERPYPVEGLWALAAAHRLDPIPVENVPPALRELVARGMAKDFSVRPPSARAFLAELETAALTGYGPDWEKRGRARLAALAAALAFLFPMAEPTATGGTALALTRLGRRRLAVVAGVAAGALIAGSGGAFVLASVRGGLTPGTTATSTPSAALEPSATPEPSEPADSPEPSDTPTATPTDTTPPATSGPASSTPSAAPTTPKPKPSPKITKITPTVVKGITVDSVRITAPAAARAGTYMAIATVTVTTSGPGSVTVTVNFSAATGEETSSSGSTEKGSGSHTLTISAPLKQCPSTVRATASAQSVTSAPTSGSIDCQVIG